jgi:hypothetical protein
MDNWRRAGAMSGIMFVVLFIVGLIVQGDAPLPTDSAEDIAAYFADNDDNYIIGDFIIGIGFLFGFLPFASVLGSHLGMAEGEPRVWSRLIIVAALVFTAAGGAISCFNGAMAYSAGTLGDDVQVALTAANYYGLTSVFSLSTALLAFCVGLLIMRKGAMWQWLGWLSLAYVIAALISYFAILGDDPESGLGILQWIVFIVFGVWTLIVSFGLWKASSEA